MEYPSPISLSPRMKWELGIYVVAAWVLIAQASAEEFNPRKVVQPFEPITNPQIVSARDAGKFVRDDELVLGVVVGKEARAYPRSEEHTSELQSQAYLVCRLLLEKKKF